MLCNLETLCRKEVINVCNGNRLGYVRDLHIDTQNACIVDLLVETDAPLSFKRKNRTLTVPWNCVQVIGDTTVLVRYDAPPPACAKEKEKRFGTLFGR